ncbi:DoxX family protein [Sulfitobacter sp. S190]|uniref:DoxX family protein n=1 Tax=Sulfitobacter sp. S190 TaxID=2867022 RepID=UPI0021A5557A|nr:DoxX family protein [Sulfitobacter sp. S190]UWR24531.1 DoxX family protein [Sulfitobacter sp. S190]
MDSTVPRPIAALLESHTFALLARIILTSPFWSSGLLKAFDFGAAVAEQQAFGLPAPAVLAGLTILVQLGGSLLVIVGRAVWLGAGMLGVFTFLATLIAHAFWSSPPDMVMRQFAVFMEHMGLIGGLILAAILSRRP